MRRRVNPGLGVPRYDTITINASDLHETGMSVTLKTVDQVLGSAPTEGPALSFAVGWITAREIVCSRVRVEVERSNSAEPPPGVVSLVAPARQERELNGRDRPPRRLLDVERQVEVALDAVRKGRVILMFNGVQVTDIDAPLQVTPVSEARFLKLVPLAGG